MAREGRMVIQIVFVIVLTGSDQAKFTKRVASAKIVDFAGGVAVSDEEKIVAAAGAFDGARRDLDEEAQAFDRGDHVRINMGRDRQG